MEIKIIRGDITKVKADAIINAANYTLLGGGGVDGAIHRAAGNELLLECKKLRETKYPEGFPTGEAVVTKGYNLPAKFIIHTVGPRYYKEDINLLKNCYINCLKLAEENNCESLAFPAISTGAYGCPIEKSAEIVREVLDNFKSDIIKEIKLVLYIKEDFEVYSKILKIPYIKLKDQPEPSENGKDFNPDAKDIRFFRDRRIKILKREEAEKQGLRYLTYVPGMAVGHAFWRFGNHFSQHVDYVEAISLEKYEKDKIGQEGAVRVEFWVNPKDNLPLHEKKHILFVCTSAMDRSPAAASLFDKSQDYEAKFAGISPGAEVTLTKEAIVWANIIFTMEPEHQRYVLEKFKQEIKAGLKEVILLNVSNDFKRHDRELMQELRVKLKEYL